MELLQSCTKPSIFAHFISLSQESITCLCPEHICLLHFIVSRINHLPLSGAYLLTSFHCLKNQSLASVRSIFAYFISLSQESITYLCQEHICSPHFIVSRINHLPLSGAYFLTSFHCLKNQSLASVRSIFAHYISLSQGSITCLCQEHICSLHFIVSRINHLPLSGAYLLTSFHCLKDQSLASARSIFAPFISLSQESIPCLCQEHICLLHVIVSRINHLPLSGAYLLPSFHCLKYQSLASVRSIFAPFISLSQESITCLCQEHVCSPHFIVSRINHLPLSGAYLLTSFHCLKNQSLKFFQFPKSVLTNPSYGTKEKFISWRNAWWLFITEIYGKIL